MSNEMGKIWHFRESTKKSFLVGLIFKEKKHLLKNQIIFCI